MGKNRLLLVLGLFIAIVGARTAGLLRIATVAAPSGDWEPPVFCDARPVASKPPLLAIVIDDLAGGAGGFQAMLDLRVPITFAVLPDRPDAGALAAQVVEHGHEVIVHVPMEATRVNPLWYSGRHLTSAQTDREIQALLANWFAALPQATGLNNHMGTTATADERVVRAVLQVAGEHGKYVLDSRTTTATVVPRVAAELGIPCMQRTLFLDHTPGKAEVAAHLRALGDLAVARGAAIGIGHVGLYGAETAAALAEVLPELEARGIQLVTLSALLELHR